jgi:hypothetical protein
MSRCAIAPPLGWLKPDLIPPPWPGAYAPVVILISEAMAASPSTTRARRADARLLHHVLDASPQFGAAFSGRGEGFATDWWMVDQWREPSVNVTRLGRRGTGVVRFN